MKREYEYIGGKGETILLDTYNFTIKKTNTCGTVTAHCGHVSPKLEGNCGSFCVVEQNIKDEEQNMSELIVMGMMDNSQDHTHESANRVYSTEGICPTINTCGGGNLEPKILGGFGEKKSNGGTQWYQQDRVYSAFGDDIAMCHPANMPDGSYKYMVEDKIVCEERCDEGLRFYSDNTVGTLRTIDSGGDKRIIEKDTQYRIRKLTPKECWRLMGFADEDFEAASEVNSASQLYKQAGNSIVVNVLEAIFGQMI